ncbi:zinc finger CCCH domain-containing protein 14 isoform X2 [Sesamum indicum]|uniref:Zinc finger CCCH domain-containing protein 14 isoform X2 n=1 Tax=Sesamum indicum TaxID=4182 RepID=A0A8M8UQL3_SESIN|nr:zinc finger CCCH domain-containing protein 14 isoform X2 [Sesamum indicum]
MDTRKRGRAEFGVNAHGGFKKSKPEIDSLSSGIGSKSKPCTKFFSMAGCPFGENCHFLHYFPGGYNAVAQMMNLTPVVPPPIQNGSTPATVKTKLCNKYSRTEGCKYHDKFHFAHGEWELGKPIIQAQEDPRAIGAIPGCFAARAEPPVPGPAGSFGASATAKISVDASLAGAIIGKGGVNSKQISRQTGAKLAIREHETDPNLRNIELEGTFEQIKQASTMVRELIVSIGSVGGPGKAIGRPGGHAAPGKAIGGHGGHAAPGSNFKTKLCENFSKGSCTFGDRCHFAHGAAELRKTGI